MYRLGSQGRAAQQRLQQQPYSSTVEFQTPSSQAQNDVNLLLSALKTPGNLSSTNLLSYIVHYLPRVRNEGNLKLLMDAFFSNRVIFPEQIHLEETYMIIEAIKATFDSKIRVSEPTLPLTKFFHGVVTSIFESGVEPWKKILVITGVILSQSTYQEQSIPETKHYFQTTYGSLINLNHELIMRVFQTTSINSEEVNALTAISLSCSLPFFSPSQRQHVPHESILLFTIHLIFQSPYGLGNHSTEFLAGSNSPVVKHLSRLSFLIENSLVHGVSFGVLDSTLNIILRFSETLHLRSANTDQSWNVLKNGIFAVVIIFQGFVSYLLKLSNRLSKQHYSSIATKILQTFFHLSFILEKIGTGGFQAYNFVYISSLDALLQYSHQSAEALGSYFTKNINLHSNDHYQVSKTLFTLTFFETLCQTTSIEYYENTISPIVDFIIHTTTHSRPLIEAAHSVVIATFIPTNSHIIASTAIPYLHTVLSQFPQLLSATQLRIAIETIARAVAPPSEAHQLNKDNLREVLHTLYIRCLNTRPGLPIPTSQPISQGQESDNNQPMTVRTGIIAALISTLPYLPTQILNNWLNNIWELTESSDPIEFQFCEKNLWEMISEGFDMQRGNVGINWWYNRGNNVEAKL
ncbi:hypothetical protein WICANDRAFT_104233 [Wickerhamomyces anomalus NRRL Y-366-8]|uniref:Peroxisomal membrane protein PEX17 n=1 Tax=Wickerhamomyces anomalus (strain ATCC 58044 / CBS 1984 / NCYC 433 / NRRL Y-366-8) TaxID=683960 RepID=A0A1E3P6Y8_WICAA|nr:uncharacterized protein WICANDRAFT_104233 [Wickerhamomyces anomalus NRRL Y-366-8]ODQ61118.1 hypothetical protein WICANDRAFT_104233 [Wickerhamomyces anomalus NRRL Y-366-8]